MRKFNFSAGPATLPQTVLESIQSEMLDWQSQGASVIEVPHRCDAIHELMQQTAQRARDLLAIPDNFKVLFMYGGARMQFAAVPMNFLGINRKAVYLDTGYWSQAAAVEAKKYADIQLANGVNWQQQPYTIAAAESWQIDNGAVYLHYCDNETIDGIEFAEFPQTDLPLVSDMSSNIFSKPIDWHKFACVYAGMQKNIGPAGLAVVVVRDDMLAQAQTITPSLVHYQTQVKYDSAFNTLSLFNVYVANKVLAWLQEQGGVTVIQQRNQRRAQKIYDVIDASDDYHNPVDPSCRSDMNIPFTLRDKALEEQFLQQAEQQGLINLKGHPSCGGIRASLYNALPDEAVDALVDFMKNFMLQKH